jgi:hypothetical protein
VEEIGEDDPHHVATVVVVVILGATETTLKLEIVIRGIEAQEITIEKMNTVRLVIKRD